MEVTLQDIAKELNVSAQTVSRSLRHDKAITPHTRARVHEVARRMGYKARLGRPRRAVNEDAKSSVIGLLVRHGSLDDLQHDTNLMKMMAGIMAVADKQGMHLKVHTRHSSEQHMDEDASLVPSMIQEGVCKALLAHGEQDGRDLDYLSHLLPIVSMGRIYPNLPIDAAVADNIDGVHRLVTHLVELGHRRLAWVGFHYSVSFMEEREAGFMKGCRKHGLVLDQHSFLAPKIEKGHGEERGIRDKDALLATVGTGVTGLVCGNDGIALTVIKALEEAGLHVPADVSVTGFDAASRTDPAKARQLTGIDPGFFEIGKATARLALQRMAHPNDQACVVSVRGNFVPGDSTAPPRDSSV